MRPLSLVLALSLTALPVAAQAPPPVDRSALAVFDRMLGEWNGPAWMIVGPGGRHDAFQREWVSKVAGGTVIAVQGIGLERTPDGSYRTVHDAFATIYLDRDGKTPRMRAFLANGQWQDVDFTAKPDGYSWGMTVPGDIRVRYDMVFDAQGRWVEKGVMSRDQGKTWMPFFEMTLTKQR